jgi:hypothetical protein
MTRKGHLIKPRYEGTPQWIMQKIAEIRIAAIAGKTPGGVTKS